MLPEESGSALLAEYVRTRIDGANLRALVRTLRMGKDGDFLKGVLTEGGDTSPEALLHVAADRGRGLTELYAPTVFASAAEAGEVMAGRIKMAHRASASRRRREVFFIGMLLSSFEIPGESF